MKFFEEFESIHFICAQMWILCEFLSHKLNHVCCTINCKCLNRNCFTHPNCIRCNDICLNKLYDKSILKYLLFGKLSKLMKYLHSLIIWNTGHSVLSTNYLLTCSQVNFIEKTEIKITSHSPLNNCLKKIQFTSRYGIEIDLVRTNTNRFWSAATNGKQCDWYIAINSKPLFPPSGPFE